eukprot:4070281-Prymnesium_polylepis.2
MAFDALAPAAAQHCSPANRAGDDAEQQQRARRVPFARCGLRRRARGGAADALGRRRCRS